MTRIFKILVKSGDLVTKQKYNESVRQFSTWLKKHRESYKHCYTVEGYEFRHGEWVRADDAPTS